MMEFQNLEKVVFGGTRGRSFTQHVWVLYSEFQFLCSEILSSRRDPLDLSSQVHPTFQQNIRTNCSAVMLLYGGLV